MAINHRTCNHPPTNAGRTECRRALAKMRAELAASIIRVDDEVMVWLDDAPSEMAGKVMWIKPGMSDGSTRYGVRMARSGNVYGVWQSRVRKV